MRSYHVEFDIEVDETSGTTGGEWEDDHAGGKRIDVDADSDYTYVPADATITETTPKVVADGYYADKHTSVVYRRKRGLWERMRYGTWSPAAWSTQEHDGNARNGLYLLLGPIG